MPLWTLLSSFSVSWKLACKPWGCLDTFPWSNHMLPLWDTTLPFEILSIRKKKSRTDSMHQKMVKFRRKQNACWKSNGSPMSKRLSSWILYNSIPYSSSNTWKEYSRSCQSQILWQAAYKLTVTKPSKAETQELNPPRNPPKTSRVVISPSFQAPSSKPWSMSVSRAWKPEFAYPEIDKEILKWHISKKNQQWYHLNNKS